jgi:hypothetical protein
LAPVLLIWLPWEAVVVGTVIVNVLWAAFARYHFVSIRAASLGVNFVLLKWVTWPAATISLFVLERRPECWIAAFWPVLIFILGALPSTAIGRIQVSFMRALGYEPTESNPLAKADQSRRAAATGLILPGGPHEQIFQDGSGRLYTVRSGVSVWLPELVQLDPAGHFYVFRNGVAVTLPPDEAARVVRVV